jgi:hypothetical protein
MIARARHAIEAFDHHFAVVRLEPNAKRSLREDYLDAPARDCGELVRWIKDGCNWGIHLGASGIVAVDVDGPEGERVLAAQSDMLGALPPTLEVKSQRPEGGRHLYFRCADAASVVKATPWLGEKLDMLAGRGHTVGPGSSIDGREYAIVAGSFAEIATMPKPWHDRLKRRNLRVSPTAFPIGRWDMGDGRWDMGDGKVVGEEVAESRDIVRSAVRGVFDRISIEQRGTANRTIFRLATNARGALPGAGDEPPEFVLRLLDRWIDRCGSNTEKPRDEIVDHFIDGWERFDANLLGLGSVRAEADLAADDPRMCEAFPNAGEKLRLLARMCVVLQRRHHQRPFFLSQREAALVLGVEQPTVGVWLRKIVKVGALELVSRGRRFDENGNRCKEAKASEYLWRW